MMIIIIVMLVATVAIGWVVLYIVRRIQSSYIRRKIAAEGFETAMDVLYPHKRRRFSKYRTGPVLSE